MPYSPLESFHKAPLPSVPSSYVAVLGSVPSSYVLALPSVPSSSVPSSFGSALGSSSYRCNALAS